ncbi:MAG: hypothetical protein ACK56I_26850, partial [bacterium]
QNPPFKPIIYTFLLEKHALACRRSPPPPPPMNQQSHQPSLLNRFARVLLCWCSYLRSSAS